MASTYTANQGIEKMDTGDQSGTWGGTVNTNMDIIDRAISGVGALTLTGSTTTLTTTDGTLTDGMYRVLVLGDGGDLGSDNTITLSPNDQDKAYLIYNNLSANRNAIFSQGTGANATVQNGETAWIYADGAGSGAAVRTAVSSVKITDQDGDTQIQVEEGGDDDDTIRFDVAGAEDFTMTANTFNVLSGSTLDVNSGATITNNGTATGFGADAERAFAGVLQTNSNFVDQTIFGPSVDGMPWNGLWSKASVFSSLMLATIEDEGSNTEINIWDLTEQSAGAISTTPLATVDLASAATPTAIAASMGYLIVSSEDGIAILDPHSGAWAERTDGWPKTLSTSTKPALTDNDVQAVAARPLTTAAYDPRTGGPMPTFVIGYGTGGDCVSVLKTDGNVFDRAGTSGNAGVAIWGDRAWYALGGTGDILNTGVKIDEMTADDWTQFIANASTEAPQGLGCENAASFEGDKGATASDLGLTVMLPSHPITGSFFNTSNAIVNRTYNSGFLLSDIRSAWLANSKTADRSYKGNTQTENGTVTEAAVASGTELLGYSGFSSSNYLSRAYDADFDFGTGAFSIMLWFKCTSTTARNIFFARDNGTYNTSNPSITFEINDHFLRWTGLGGSTSWDTISPQIVDDGEWHFGVINSQNAAQELFVDGVSVMQTTISMGTLSNGSAVTTIGERPNSTSPAAQMTLALFRISATQPTATQVRQMYDAEKGMFVASAECLLQSGSTDAVIDVDVDPLTGKVLVTQTDAITVFDGLVVDSKPTVNSGASEKGKLWGALRAEQNSANAYVTAPAVDQRQVNEMVRGLASDMPGGVDLSKAKAWLLYDQSAPAITSSYNVKSVTDNSAGNYTVNFAIPFKIGSQDSSNASYTIVSNSSDDSYAGVNNIAAGWVNIKTRDNAGSLADAVRQTVVCFGELENE